MEGWCTHVAINVVRVDAVAPLLGRKLDARRHDVAHVLALEVQPALAGPVVHGLAEVGLCELLGVGAPLLVRAGAEVADDLLAEGMERRDGLGAIVEEVNVVDVHVGRHGGPARVDAQWRVEDDLPGRADGRDPGLAGGARVNGEGVGGHDEGCCEGEEGARVEEGPHLGGLFQLGRGNVSSGAFPEAVLARLICGRVIGNSKMICPGEQLEVMADETRGAGIFKYSWPRASSLQTRAP